MASLTASLAPTATSVSSSASLALAPLPSPSLPLTSPQGGAPLAVKCSSQLQGHRQQRWTPARAATLAATMEEAAAATTKSSSLKPENVRQITSLAQYEVEMARAQDLNRLLVVEFTKQSLPNTQRTYQSLVDLTNTTPDVTFLRVFADSSPDLRELCVEHDVTQIPSFVFIRNGQKVHRDTGLHPEKLREQVLYYGQAEYPVCQLENVEDLNTLLKEQKSEDRLVVVQVTLNFCGPCVRVYPAVLQLSHKMAGSVVFARLFGDANEGTRQFVREMGIVEAPTFLFYRGGELLGRYVGSGKGELVGEVLRYQGVQCT